MIIPSRQEAGALIARHRVALSAVMLLIGLAIPYYGLGSEMIGRDEAYQAFSVRHYMQNPMAMLVFWIGHQWQGLVGESILNLRILMVLCYQLSIGLACLYLYRTTRSMLLTSAVFLLMALGSRFVTLYIYGWDSGAYPAMTLFTISLLCYVRRPGMWRIVATGVATAFMVACRVPTLSALPLILVCIILARRDAVSRRVEWGKVLADSVAGLAVFGVVFFGLVLMMTGGRSGLYVDAWVPDNIINGHFDRAYVSWRWKNLARRTVQAFYPMLLCFGCACYMLRVRRKYWLNLAGCAFVSATMSFYYIKTCLLYNEFAPGIFEGLYGAILFLPLLYGMTHQGAPRVRWLPLLAITGCGFVACVGSDGFLERFMTINTVPLLCALVYSRYRSVMRCFLSLALLSTAVMCAFSVYVPTRGAKKDYSSYPHLAGIVTNGYDEYIESRFREISPVLEELKDKGASYAIVGDMRFVFDYVFRGEPAYNFQRFHYFDTEEELQTVRGLIPVNDYIIIMNMRPTPNTDSMLASSGYTLERGGEYYRLYRREGVSGCTEN